MLQRPSKARLGSMRVYHHNGEVYDDPCTTSHNHLGIRIGEWQKSSSLTILNIGWRSCIDDRSRLELLPVYRFTVATNVVYCPAKPNICVTADLWTEESYHQDISWTSRPGVILHHHCQGKGSTGTHAGLVGKDLSSIKHERMLYI